MNSYDFTVVTPQEWKDELLAKTSTNKPKRIKPVALFAAVLAVLIGVSGTAFAGKVMNAPEYFGSIFLGNTLAAGEVYSVKNTVLESSREDLQMTCTGIIGDEISLHLIFRITSTGDLLFDPAYNYLFENNDQDLGFFPSMGRGIGCKVIDERTLEMHMDMTGIGGGNFVGKKVGFFFENLEKFRLGGDFSDLEVIPCAFEGTITVDYTNTTQKLTVTENELTVDGVTMKAGKAKISNMNFWYEMKVTDGQEIVMRNDDFINLVHGVLTITFADGSVQNYDLQHPPVDDNDIFASSVGRTGDTLTFVLHLPSLIHAADIKSIAWNDTLICIR
ncbi:MAG: DUF4179 domain-containing protein [Clostridia bacterium]|nr:DUF4179 domain-containing protein [Clostridia bacterium]